MTKRRLFDTLAKRVHQGHQKPKTRRPARQFRETRQNWPTLRFRLAPAQLFAATTPHLGDIVVTARPQVMQIQPNILTPIRLSTERLLGMIANTRSSAGRARKRS